MALLTQAKQDVDAQFGLPVMADNLIDDNNFQGEEAYEYDVGDFQVIVGFYKNIGRYACFTKQSGAILQFAPEDVEACLMLIAPLDQWNSSTDTAPSGNAPAGNAPASPAPAGGNPGVTIPTVTPHGITPPNISAADTKPPSPAPAAPKAAPAAPPQVIGGIGTTTNFHCTITDAAGNKVGVLGWHRTTKSYVFVYCPMMMPPQPAIAASPMVIDENLP